MTQAQVIVFRRRTNVLAVSLGIDVSEDNFTSEIRADKSSESTLLASWAFAFLTDGTDGELILTLDDSDTESIPKTIGYMDIKRFTAGESVQVFDEPLEVVFKDPITA